MGLSLAELAELADRIGVAIGPPMADRRAMRLVDAEGKAPQTAHGK